MWLKLEDHRQSEVSQREKDKYQMIFEETVKEQRYPMPEDPEGSRGDLETAMEVCWHFASWYGRAT